MGELPTISSADDPVEFYLPATFQFGRGAGRVERFLRRAFGNRDEIDRPTVDSHGPEFYLPATPDVEPAKSR